MIEKNCLKTVGWYRLCKRWFSCTTIATVYGFIGVAQCTTRRGTKNAGKNTNRRNAHRRRTTRTVDRWNKVAQLNQLAMLNSFIAKHADTINHDIISSSLTSRNYYINFHCKLRVSKATQCAKDPR